MDIKLHQLRALVGVVEFGGIRAAARHLHVSQAAMTKSLRQLEEDAGLPLLVRSPRGVNLTPAGQRLYARANLVTRQLDLASSELRDAVGDADGHVGVALTPYVVLRHLGQAFRWFRQRYPRVTVEVIEGLVSRTLPRMRDGSLDLAIVAHAIDLPSGEFDVRRVATATQHVAVREGHPVLRNPTVEALSELDWLLAGPRHSLLGEHVKAMFARAQAPVPTRIMACDALAAMALLRESDCAGIVPGPLFGLPETRGLVRVDVPQLDAGELKLVLLTRPDVPLTPAAQYLADCLVQAVGAG